MDRIVDFWKRKYKILIPVMVVSVLLVAVYFLYKEYKYDNYRNKQDMAVYQYFGGIKSEYTATITYNLKNMIVEIKAKDKNIEYDSTPIYEQDNNKIIFPSEMSIIFPIKDVSQYRLYKYTILGYDDNIFSIKNGNNEREYSDFFLFDGKGLFFFPENVKLYIDGSEYIELSAMSYVKIVGGYTMEYYDKEKDVAKVVEIEGKEIVAKNDKMEVNLTERYVLHFNNKTLLVKPDYLNSISN